jgi:hypothetical protein
VKRFGWSCRSDRLAPKATGLHEIPPKSAAEPTPWEGGGVEMHQNFRGGGRFCRIVHPPSQQGAFQMQHLSATEHLPRPNVSKLLSASNVDRAEDPIKSFINPSWCCSDLVHFILCLTSGVLVTSDVRALTWWCGCPVGPGLTRNLIQGDNISQVD